MAVIPINGMIIDSTGGFVTTTSTAIDAAGESVGAIGYLSLQNRATGKVISAAGSGKIYWRTGAVTFANGATNLRIGLQDVNLTTGLEDGTFDVNVDLVPGVDTVAASSFQKSTMDTGTKTVSHGDLIACVAELTARAGADSIALVRLLTDGTLGATNFPYGTVDTGLHQKSTTGLMAYIETDDGTMGWITGWGLSIFNIGYSTISYNVGSTPDEYLASFIADAPYVITGVEIRVTAVGATDAFDYTFWQDPYGTPVSIVTGTWDLDLMAVGNGFVFPVSTTLVTGVEYGISFRPTSVNNCAWNYFDFTTGIENLKKISAFTSPKMGARTGNTGAFSVTQTYHMPLMQLIVMGIDIPSVSVTQHASVF